MRKLCNLRKVTMEHLFGTAKENYGFRYTQMIGEARLEMKAGITFAYINLKKLTKMKQKLGLLKESSNLLLLKYREYSL